MIQSKSQSIFLLNNEDIHTVLAMISWIEAGNEALIEEEKDLRRRLKEVINGDI